MIISAHIIKLFTLLKGWLIGGMKCVCTVQLTDIRREISESCSMEE